MHPISTSDSLLETTQLQDRAARHSGQHLQQRAWGFEDEVPALKCGCRRMTRMRSRRLRECGWKLNIEGLQETRERRERRCKPENKRIRGQKMLGKKNWQRHWKGKGESAAQSDAFNLINVRRVLRTRSFDGPFVHRNFKFMSTVKSVYLTVGDAVISTVFSQRCSY